MLRGRAPFAFAAVALASVTFARGGENAGADPVRVEAAPTGLSTTDWSTIRAAHEADRYAVLAASGGHQARNAGQEWLSFFDGHGVSTHPDAGGWTWGLQLKGYGFACEERDVCEPVQVTASGARMAYDWDATLEEWWINDACGLEHGYTVRERPSQSEAGPLTITLVVRGDLLPHVQDDGRCVRFSTAGGTDVLTYSGLVVLDADGRALAAHFVHTGSHLLLSIDERSARYPLTVDPIAQQAYLKPSNTAAGDYFGWSVSVSGDTAVVGAVGEGGSGAAYVFVRSGGSWSQQAYLKASNSNASDGFGYSVSVSGDTVLVGAPSEDSNTIGVNGNQADNSAPYAGAAYVFVRGGTTWSQQAYLKASNTDSNDSFGWSVAASGDTVVIGAYGERSNASGVNGNQLDNSADTAGAAYVFARSGTTWTQQAYLKASNTGLGGGAFGYSVSLSGDTAVVGAVYEGSSATGVNGNQNDNSAFDAGAAYVFVRGGTTWSQQAYLKASNAATVDVFGFSVSVADDTVVVGAPYEDSNALGVNGDQSNNTASEAGAAYVFARSGNTWSQQAYLKASNPGSSDQFGYSVAVSGDSIVIGAHLEDSSATGVGGNQSDNGTGESGAAYVFLRSGTTWSQQAYLKASNTGFQDDFGYSVSVSGDTVVVGAEWEDSNATGVNGSQSNDGAFNAGAAYVFVLDPNPAGYCFGDGSGTPCPCGHAGTLGHGCPNFAFPGGGHLAASGVASVSSDSLALTSTNIIPSAPGLYFQGSVPVTTGVVFGNGLLCLAGSTPRLEIGFADAFGASSTTVEIHTVGNTAGNEVRYYQMWYRDDPVFCPSAGSNLTNALSLTWLP